MHQHNLIHRDIKPSNLLLDKNCQVLLADFGQSVSIENLPNMNIAGTRNYRSPESVLGG